MPAKPTRSRSSGDRAAALRTLHAAAREMGLSEETRRDVMERMTGLRSAADMTAAQIRAVLDEFRRLGWSAGRRRISRRADVRKIFGLWKGLGEAGALRTSGSAACRAWVRRQSGVDDPDWLTPEQARACIEALKQWLDRETSRQTGR